MNKEIDNLISRLWYFEGSWSPMPENWSEIAKHTHIFLTNAPLTFGHSQMVVPGAALSDSNNESDLFHRSAFIIESILKTHENLFGDKKIHAEKRFKKLAEATCCHGAFIKTLILRTSASENPNSEFKVHLVPYFESSQNDCLKRYHSLHRDRPDANGGLIGWLGERETQVDKWLIEGFPGPVSLDDVGAKIWKLPELSAIFKQTIKCQQITHTDPE